MEFISAEVKCLLGAPFGSALMLTVADVFCLPFLCLPEGTLVLAPSEAVHIWLSATGLKLQVTHSLSVCLYRTWLQVERAKPALSGQFNSMGPGTSQQTSPGSASASLHLHLPAAASRSLKRLFLKGL